MKFAYSWLKELVDIRLSPDKLAEFLSLHAFETEADADQKVFSGIIVAKVTKIEKHPNADRLRIITLTDGRNTFGPVVCGAWNFDVGATVPLALPGGIIPHDQHDPDGKPFTLSKAIIRGVESQGMICSAKELGLGADGGGILLLDSGSKLGEPFAIKNSSSEPMLDVSVPANRPDLISYRGVAWEISALTGAKYKIKNKKSKLANLPSKVLKVRISDPALCSKYIGVRLVNIKIKESPKFIQDRLKLSGMRPINNVVDITNYVMLEIGQPLHAFDATMVTGPINVRKAYLNESLKTLDGVERKLTTNMLVIADAKKPLAIAGVMGGAESAVIDFTGEVILEAANFNSVSIRRTARNLGLRTDASSRFEKSLPVGLAMAAAEYAVELLVKYASAKPLEYAEAGIKKEKPITVKVDAKKVNALLGTDISVSEQERILKRFGFALQASHSTLQVTVPFWRPDVRIWEDLAEEIVRFEGLDKIPDALAPLPNSSGMTDQIVDEHERVADLLTGMGFNEAYTYSFVPESIFDKYGIDRKQAVEIANPMSSDQQYLRQGLGMNYERLIGQNGRYVSEESLFEIGNVYRKTNGSVEEHTNLFLICFSKTRQPAGKLIGSIRELFGRLGVEMSIAQVDEEMGEVSADGEKLGPIRAVNEELKWAAAELNFEKLIKHIKPKQFVPPSKYPAEELDAAILVREDLPWGEIKELILKSNKQLIKSATLFDVYQGKNVSPGKKSLGFRIVYQADNRTLKDEEVTKIHKEILNELKSKFHAEIRD
ncbi:MAG: phenylalanine--tRNA ligase subunit beta [Candidatus Doudnabacteria bacterium]